MTRSRRRKCLEEMQLSLRCATPAALQCPHWSLPGEFRNGLEMEQGTGWRCWFGRNQACGGPGTVCFSQILAPDLAPAGTLVPCWDPAPGLSRWAQTSMKGFLGSALHVHWRTNTSTESGHEPALLSRNPGPSSGLQPKAAALTDDAYESLVTLCKEGLTRRCGETQQSPRWGPLRCSCTKEQLVNYSGWSHEHRQNIK